MTQRDESVKLERKHKALRISNDPWEELELASVPAGLRVTFGGGDSPGFSYMMLTREQAAELRGWLAEMFE